MVKAMRISVAAWSPEYSAEIDLGPDEVTVEQVDCSVEPGPWEPRSPGDIGALADMPLAFVDGTRRIDARLFLSDNGSAPVSGVAGSVGVGAVVCDPAPGGPGGRTTPASEPRRARVAELRVDRFLAAGEGTRASLSGSAGLTYQPLPVPGKGNNIDGLVGAVHESMRVREAQLALEMASDHLVFCDGPFAVMRPEPVRVVAFIKSHQRRYLDEDHEQILGKLGCGERTPLFAFGEPRPRYSWYLRLCALSEDDHAWHGLVRCEAPASLGLQGVIQLADASASLLPQFASLPHWDPRAPQNLVPVAGLEKRLRHLLGDRELVYRMIRSAARKAGDGGDRG